jgi:hypothetical protein
MDVGVGIEYKAPAGSQKQSRVVGRLRQQALHKLQTKGKSFPDQFDILVVLINRVTGSQSVTHHIDGVATHRTASAGQKEKEK